MTPAEFPEYCALVIVIPVAALLYFGGTIRAKETHFKVKWDTFFAHTEDLFGAKMSNRVKMFVTFLCE